jgi:hypothetical protein
MPMHRLALVLLVAPLLSVGCGDSGNPTQPTPRSFVYEGTSEGFIAAGRSVCVSFRQEATGPASASAGFNTPIEIGSGTCTTPGAVVNRNELGSLEVTLPVGEHFVRVYNHGENEARYRLTVRYLILA